MSLDSLFHVLSVLFSVIQSVPFTLYYFTAGHPEKSLLQSGVNTGTDVFLWNGKEVRVSYILLRASIDISNFLIRCLLVIRETFPQQCTE